MITLTPAGKETLCSSGNPLTEYDSGHKGSHTRLCSFQQMGASGMVQIPGNSGYQSQTEIQKTKPKGCVPVFKMQKR